MLRGAERRGLPQQSTIGPLAVMVVAVAGIACLAAYLLLRP